MHCNKIFSVQKAIWKSRHRHLGIISIIIRSAIGIGIAKVLFLRVFLKNRVFLFSLVLRYGISTILLQIFISLRFPKKEALMNFRKHPSAAIFKK